MKLGQKNSVVELYDHQAEWEKLAEDKMEYFKNILGDIIIEIQHIGSTSIKNIKAKPIIDIIIGINDFKNLDNIMNIMKNNGIIHSPKNDLHEFRMFVIWEDKENEILTHIIHLVKYDGEEWNNKINFRDYMNNNIDKAKEYEKLKIKLMEKNKENHSNYHKNKELFIKEVIKKANKWKNDLVKNGKPCTFQV
jgi:GrpB-like predicted nucleotidyltransferase (UPF0157 family)